MGLFSDLLFKKSVSDTEIEASQVDQFSSEHRIDELKTILGQDQVSNRKDYFNKLAEISKESSWLNFKGMANPLFYNRFKSAFQLALILRKDQQNFKETNSQTKCFTSEELDEMLNIDELIKQPHKLQRKCEQFETKVAECMKDTSSDVFSKVMEYETSEKFRESHSGILVHPIPIEILKSRYLPNKSIIEKKEIESELMEPFVYNPKTDSELDIDRKLMALSKSQFLKHDIEYVNKCYQTNESDIKKDCYFKYLLVMNLSNFVVCKREILQSGNIKFPNIEDSSVMDLETIEGGICDRIMANSGKKLFPNMPDFTK